MAKKRDTKISLFLELAKPNSKTGVSRWVYISEFVGKYAKLNFGNGADWARSDGTLGKTYEIERDKSITKGNSIDRIRLNGFSKRAKFSQTIRSDIKKEIKKQRCLILGTSSPEPDHKNGRKDDPRVWNTKTQTLEDFQPLSKHANDAKREVCKKCKNTGNRFDAKKLGYPISFTKGKLKYQKKFGCIGCFWYDPLAFRKQLKITDD